MLGNAEADTSKHERTTRMFTSTTSDSPPSHTKVSFRTRSSTQEKLGSNEQGQQSSGGILKGGDPSLKKNEGEKKKTLILHLKKRSTKELSENAKLSKSEFVGEPSEEIIVKHGSVLKHPPRVDLSTNTSKTRRQTSLRDSKRPGTKKLDIWSDDDSFSSENAKHSKSEFVGEIVKHGGVLKLKKHPPRVDLYTNKSKTRRQTSQRDSKRFGTKKLDVLSDGDTFSSPEPSTSLDNSESLSKRKPSDGKTPSSSTTKGKKKVKFVEKKHPEVLKEIPCYVLMFGKL